jgi:two-component system, chemotaxis family, response regulator Rcp1
MSATSSADHRILLVEDNPGDIQLTKMAVKSGPFQIQLDVVKNGEDALDFLFHRGEHQAALRPDLIILDLNIPKKNGKEILAIIKEDANLKTIPVCVLSGSKAELDVAESYALHANCYAVKPLQVDDYIATIKALERFWFETVMISRN